jgi:hypothetical protein
VKSTAGPFVFAAQGVGVAHHVVAGGQVLPHGVVLVVGPGSSLGVERVNGVGKVVSPYQTVLTADGGAIHSVPDSRGTFIDRVAGQFSRCTDKLFIVSEDRQLR